MQWASSFCLDPPDLEEVNNSTAILARPARGRKTIKRGPGKRIVEGKSSRLADEVRYIQRRAAGYDSRIVTHRSADPVLHQNRQCLAA
jgi:hypothetical protein